MASERLSAETPGCNLTKAIYRSFPIQFIVPSKLGVRSRSIEITASYLSVAFSGIVSNTPPMVNTAPPQSSTRRVLPTTSPPSLSANSLEIMINRSPLGALRIFSASPCSIGLGRTLKKESSAAIIFIEIFFLSSVYTFPI